ncbi:MAG TPA: hypothetical protein VFL97_03745 [Nitrococcus sp.]|nr:hypothetical protein [Nitrococcus sp.]
MVRAITVEEFTEDRQTFQGTGGVSANNRSLGFVPAFLDTDTGIVYISRNPNGTLASCHCLDGLPDALIAGRDRKGRVVAVKVSVIAGFERGGCFFTREQAALFAATEET